MITPVLSDNTRLGSRSSIGTHKQPVSVSDYSKLFIFTTSSSINKQSFIITPEWLTCHIVYITTNIYLIYCRHVQNKNTPVIYKVKNKVIYKDKKTFCHQMEDAWFSRIIRIIPHNLFFKSLIYFIKYFRYLIIYQEQI